MEPFTKLTAQAVPIDLANVDTDQIIPARFLKRPRDERYPSYLFHDLRYAEDGAERPDFILNQGPFRGAGIVVAERNFGCGSSREAAVYALMANGMRCVIAPSFGDIFFSNASKNGLLPVVVNGALASKLRRQLHERPGAEMTVDLERQTLIAPDGASHAFEVDPARKERLIKGLDDIQITLGYADAIAGFEERQAKKRPWVVPER